MADFDYWSRDRLGKLVSALRDCEESCGKFGQRLEPPAVSDKVYWRTLADMCAVEADSDDDDDESPEVTFANNVHAECEAVQSFTQVSTGIAVGDLDAAESRLLLHLRGVKSVLYASSHEMDPLWEKDGILYHTIVVSCAKESSKTLASSLGDACAFLSKHKPALICSSCPKLRATVAAALMHFESPIEMPVADAIDRLVELDVLTESETLGLAEQSALIEFSASDFSAMGYGTMSPHMGPHMMPASPRGALQPVGADLPTPGNAGKRPAPPMDTLAFKLNPSKEAALPALPGGITRSIRQMSEEIL